MIIKKMYNKSNINPSCVDISSPVLDIIMNKKRYNTRKIDETITKGIFAIAIVIG
jgi:hypothetical protein